MENLRHVHIQAASVANGFPSTCKVGAFQWLGYFGTFSTNMSQLYQWLMRICCCQRVTDAPRIAHFTVIARCQIHIHLAEPQSWHATITNCLNPSGDISKASYILNSFKVILMTAVHTYDFWVSEASSEEIRASYNRTPVKVIRIN